MKKGSLVSSFVIILLVSLITMILLISIIYFYINDSKVQNANYECRMLFSSIDPGKDFGKNFNEIPLKLEQAIQKICPSRDAKVSEKSVEDAAKLIEECWFKTGAGRDFLGKNAEGTGLSMCVYCGTIKPMKNADDIQNFNELLLEELEDERYKPLFSNDTQIENTNSFTLKNSDMLPDRINSNTPAAVVYYIHKPQVRCEYEGTFSECGKYIRTSISTFFAGFDRLRGVTNLVSQSSVRAVGGIVLLPIEVKDGFEGSIDISQFEALGNCHFIVPEENFS